MTSAQSASSASIALEAVTKHRRHTRLILASSGIALAVLCAVSLAIGAYTIPLADIVSTLTAQITGTQSPSAHTSVIWDIRMVRVLLSAAVGAGLAVSGSAFQATFRNPLVEPYVLGVSSGAAFGAGLVVIFAIPAPLAIFAFFGGLFAVSLTFAVSRTRGEHSTLVLVLSGIVVGSFFMALFSIFQYVGSDAQLRRLVFWIMGGFYSAEWHHVWSVLPLTVLGVIVLTLLGWRLNLLTLGDEQCRALGVAPRPLRLSIVLVATALTAVAVSVSGVIAWVGLLIPHAARLIVGTDNRAVVPMSAILGAAFLVVCDDLARTLHSGEIPIGIITSLIGAPFLIVLLRRRATHWGAA